LGAALGLRLSYGTQSRQIKRSPIFLRKSLFLRHVVFTPRHSGDACCPGGRLASGCRTPRHAAITATRNGSAKQIEAPPRKCDIETLALFDVSSEHRKETSKILERSSKDSRGKPFAAARAPRRNNFTASHGRHPGTKPVPALAHKLARLVGPLHRAAPIPVPITQ
jgi:hypothetical protein